MAILWSRNIEGNHYEVRSAGATLRLYRNGVHHSQWNPNRPLNGSIWDLFALPALHRPAGTIKNALILGFGAGAAGRLLRDVIGAERIVGIELDEVHLSIADGFFECSEGCELIAGDAVDWLYSQEGEAECFDLIIDDLYGEDEGIPLRYAPLDDDWFRILVDRLTPGGVLILNILEPEKIRYLAPARDPEWMKRLPYSIVYEIDGYENRVVAYSSEPFSEATFAEQLVQVCRKYPACSGVRKRYLLS